MNGLTQTEIIHQENIENGERFQFVALSSSWKNQRRKRRQLAREQQQQETTDKTQQAICDDDKTQAHAAVENSIAEKRRRLDENPETGSTSVMDVIKSSESPPLLHIEFGVLSKTVNDLKAIVEIQIAFLNGTAGLNGVYEILQYIQNKW